MAIGLTGANGLLNSEMKFEWKQGLPDGSPLPQATMELLD